MPDYTPTGADDMIANPADTQSETESPFIQFDMHAPLVEAGKHHTRLPRTDILYLGLQSIANGGETNLHKHDDQDAAWIVLDGRAKFYTEGDRVVATIGKNEGLVIPRGTLYWFESEGDECLVILRVAAKHPDIDGYVRKAEERVSRDNTKIKEGAYYGR
jgi:mannose-6-phosphate isomerase-like protein (cupin superfamily)